MRNRVTGRPRTYLLSEVSHFGFCLGVPVNNFLKQVTTQIEELVCAGQPGLLDRQ